MCHLISWPVPWECVLHTFHFTRKRTRAREINRLAPVTWRASGRALLQPVEEYFTLLSSLLLPRTGGGGDRWAELCWDTPASQYQCVSFLLLIFTETLRLGKGSRSGWRELRHVSTGRRARAWLIRTCSLQWDSRFLPSHLLSTDKISYTGNECGL